MPDRAKIPASVSIIAHNEEAQIGRCLSSVADFAEVVVVVDEKTTDKTGEIARGLGARVFVEGWKGFGPQKQSAIEKCSNDWVLVLDADEVLPEETAKEIAGVLTNSQADAYMFPRKNHLRGRWMRNGDWWPDWQVRLVNRKKGRFDSAVHERWVTEGVYYGKIRLPIEHYPFSGYSDMLETLNRYSTAIAEDLFSKGRRANPLAPVSHALWMFLRIYIFKRGFLDGFDGLVTALLKAGGSFFKYAKLLELQREKKKREAK